MPNWVFNSLTINGPAEKVAKLQYDLTRPRPNDAKGSMSEETVDKFSFWNIKAPTNLEAYFVTVGTGEGMTKASLRGDGDNWYEWNIRNWGTKWDASEPTHDFVTTKDGIGELLIRFETAWGAPIYAYDTLIERCTAEGLSVSIFYEEETGWGGEIEVDAQGNGTHSEWEMNPYSAQEQEEDEEIAPWTEEGN